ncbi:MAG: DUF5518 domain-containing protein [Methanobacteriaceae archaeon]|nr:DUF5518 domain-containing protein [Methanobacteriaceae archaeon]OPY20536.1 MAG: hypothetical protein A4E26_01834 [Methanobacterium sp. PtaU1.Bin097]
MFSQKNLLMGIVLTLIFTLVLEVIFGPWGGYVGVFLAGIIVAIYSLENEYKTNAIRGVIIGFFVSIILIMLLVIISLGNGEPIWIYITGGGILTLLFTIFIFTGLAAAGNTLGVFVKKMIKQGRILNRSA